ncbi:MAG: formylglycine-generating enzyme family protein [Chitinispirillia bacterium]|nr:formylglycine-generating enzyme family protein [Chitinispirillia bacterium]
MKATLSTVFTLLLAMLNTPVSAQDTGSSAQIEIEMVFVEGGTFVMGCPDDEAEECRYDERPARCVTLDNFYIGKYEVTQKQWLQVMGDNPSTWMGDNSRPVNGVNRYMVQEFINKLNGMTGRKYRLPTEAEWEYAARGGLKSEGYRYSGGNDLDEVAWFRGNSEQNRITINSGDAHKIVGISYKTQPVGRKKANELGIHDMTGNVQEWVSDVYGKYVWKPGEANPRGPAGNSHRALRGCSAECTDEKRDMYKKARVISRTSSEYSVSDNTGLRLAADAPKSPNTKKTRQAMSYKCGTKPRFATVADSTKSALAAKRQRCKQLPNPPGRSMKQREALPKEFSLWLEKELLPNLDTAKLTAASHDTIYWNIGYAYGYSPPKDFIPDYFKYMQRDFATALQPDCKFCSISEDVLDGDQLVATKSSKYFDDCDRFKFWEYPLIRLSVYTEDMKQTRYSFMRAGAGKGFKLVAAIIRDSEAIEFHRVKAQEARKSGAEQGKR